MKQTKQIRLILMMILLSIASFGQKGLPKAKSLIYATPEAYYGYRILIEGKVVLDQTAVQNPETRKEIYFNKAEAEKAAAYLIGLIDEAKPAKLICNQTWLQIKTTISNQ